MHLQEFLGQVQHLAHMPSMDDALRATRCTLETLAERLEGNEPHKLSSELPTELKTFVDQPPDHKAERFDSDEFLARVSEREHIDLPVAVHHVRAVLEVLQSAISAGAIRQLKAQLPEDYDRLFAGSQGKMPSA